MKLHSKFCMGKKVVVRLRDGTTIRARFKARKSNRYIFFDHPDIRPVDITSIYLFKMRAEGQYEEKI